MPGVSARPGTLLLIGLSALLLIGAFLASTGFFIIDEVIYFAGADAVWSRGSFVVENGFDEFGTESLKLWLLVEGPHGLVPQYPVGSAVLGAPLLALFGIRGLILLNALAAVGTLFATRALACRLFQDEKVAFGAVLLLAGATFWAEYAFAIWPHSVSVFFVTVALYFALVSFASDENPIRGAAAAGFAVGCGFLFRTDTILVLPAIGASAILFAARPAATIAGGVAGLAPPVAVAAWANFVKFGSLNPLSYGPDRGGGVSLATHAVPIAAMALFLLLLVAVRRFGWRPFVRRTGWAIAGLALACLLLVPQVKSLVLHYAAGVLALVVDATTIHDPRPGVGPGPDGTLLFWGLAKKALGQSMPWLGILLLLLTARPEPRQSPAVPFIVILVAIWTAPFFMLSWHGGLGSNMRYFLPLFPALSALGAKLLIDLIGGSERSHRIAVWGGIAGLLLTEVWIFAHPSGAAGAEQILSTFVFLAVAVTALLHRLPYPFFRQAAVLSAGAGLAMAALFSVMDLANGQHLRERNRTVSDALASLPGHSLVVGMPEHFASQIARPDRLVAVNDRLSGRPDLELLQRALALGYRVFVPAFLAERIPGASYSVLADDPAGRDPRAAFAEITSLPEEVSLRKID